MKHNEDTRVKLPLLAHMYRLGYTYLSKKQYTIDKSTNIFREVFKSSLERINNRTFSEDEIDSLIREINNLIEDKTNGKSFYNRLVSTSNPIKLIDFVDINNNSFNTVSELTFENKGDEFRPDVNILLNGIPLAFIEVKKPNNSGGIKKEFDRNVYRATNAKFYKFMNLIQIIGMSNNMEYNDDFDFDTEEVMQGSFYTTPNGKNTGYNYFREEREQDLIFENSEIPLSVIKDILIDNNFDVSTVNTLEFQDDLSSLKPANRLATSIFTKSRFLLILRYGIVYVNTRTLRNQKHIARYPQIFAMLNMKDMLDKNIKKGILWHTQGSGKTALAYFSSRYIRDYFADRNIKSKFYFIVDRLDLKSQAEEEFTGRGLDVNGIETKNGFIEDFKSLKTTNNSTGSTGQMTVVNIHKFSEDSRVTQNDYNLYLQRVYYIDEVHRSYKREGLFLENLIKSDKDAIYIGLTGTPVVIEGKKTKDIFGDYIHKYFYDKSILDGYTLKIKRENIETDIKHQLSRYLEQALVEEGSGNKDIFYESNLYCSSIAKYIESNFLEFRRMNEDDSLGSMIVSYSSKQAKKLASWFNENSNLKVALILHDVGTKDERKQMQQDFKDGKYDILIVYNMLLTGFDAPRLKKLYLNRKVKEHGLLQTLTRVNRTYTNPYTAKKYKYGYVVDFVDIREDYDSTTRKYIAELKEDLGMEYDDSTISSMFVDIDDILKDYLELCGKYKKALTLINVNLNEFEKEFITDKPIGSLRAINNSLCKIKEYYKELVFSKKEGIPLDLVNFDRLNKALGLLKDRINFLQQQEVLTKNKDIYLILEKLEKECIIDFIKVNIDDLNPAEIDDELSPIRDLLNDIEILTNQCADKQDAELIAVGEEVRRILLSIYQSKTKRDIEEVKRQLLIAKKRIETIKNKDRYLNSLYKGDIVCLRVHKKYIREFKVKVNLSQIESEDLNIDFIYGIYHSKNVLDEIRRNDSNYKVEALESKFKSSAIKYLKQGLTMKQKIFIVDQILIESNLKN